tara:strand:+ start:2845 stop:3048 length:204 start_codon:yes stop_codon:yes gene_type:complete
MMENLHFNNNKNKKHTPVEITIQVRDHQGKPTGKTKSFGSDNFSELSVWYNKQSASKKRKKRQRRKK